MRGCRYDSKLLHMVHFACVVAHNLYIQTFVMMHTITATAYLSTPDSLQASCTQVLLRHQQPMFESSSHVFLLVQDYDDDGEDAAGSRLLHLLQILDVKNTVVVVSRWYGGVKLGPARFTHINNAARLLLEKCGYLQPAKVTAVTSKKKGKKQ